MALKNKFYFQQIAELVHDDNSIVTSTIFSAVAKIKVNEAQDLLDEYAKTADNISCTYLITGYTKNGISILISKTNELKKKKAVFNNIISQHIYSIQRSDTDSVTLENTELFNGNISSEPLLGSVVSNKAVKRKLKKNVIKQEKERTETKNNAVKQEKQPVETKLSNPKSGSVANFCVPGNNVQNIKPVVNTKSKQKNMMANFFSKTQKIMEPSEDLHATENTKTDILKNPSMKNILTNDKTNETESESIENDNTVHIIGPEVEKEKNRQSKNSESPPDSCENNKIEPNKNRKRKKTKTLSNQESKKRKRIIETQDSDSDIFASSESENEADINLSDEPENFQKKPLSPIKPQKTRRMKQVTEEFIDEDGYMNTVQKYVVISDDEVENKDTNQENRDKTQGELTKKNLQKGNPEMSSISNKNGKLSPSKKNNKNGKSKNAKGVNQASIMDFFKKN